jgi:hypothetical protein
LTLHKGEVFWPSNTHTEGYNTGFREDVGIAEDLNDEHNIWIHGILPDWTPNKKGQTPLAWAAKDGNETVVKLLLDMSMVEVDSKDMFGRTPLSWAAEQGHEGVVKMLLDTGKVEVDFKDICGRTPLWEAAKNGHEAIVKLLLDTGKADADFKDMFGRTPLWEAAKNEHEAVVKLLLGTGKAEADFKDIFGQTPWKVAKREHEGAPDRQKAKSITSMREYLARSESYAILTDSSHHQRKYNKITRNHICLVCHKAFMYPKDLRRHESTHTGEKKHKCHLCTKTFTRIDNLGKHVRDDHPLMTPSESQSSPRALRAHHYAIKASKGMSEDKIEEDVDSFRSDSIDSNDFESEPELPRERQQSLDAIKKTAARQLLCMYHSWVVTQIVVECKGSSSHADQPAAPSGTQEGSSSRSERGKRRKRDQDSSNKASSEDDEEHPEDRRNTKRQRPKREVNLEARLFACPFYKRSPRKHLHCNRYKLDDINRVK